MRPNYVLFPYLMHVQKLTFFLFSCKHQIVKEFCRLDCIAVKWLTLFYYPLMEMSRLRDAEFPIPGEKLNSLRHCLPEKNELKKFESSLSRLKHVSYKIHYSRNYQHSWGFSCTQPFILNPLTDFNPQNSHLRRKSKITFEFEISPEQITLLNL